MGARGLITAAAAAIIAVGLTASPVRAAGDGIELPSLDWSFAGVFGTFDRGELQRGFQVYKEVCSGCHSLNYIAFRNLADLGFNELEVKAIAADYEVEDGPNIEGEMFNRPGLPADRIPAPFPNDNAARAGNGGALPPDLSLMVDARPNGANYVYALLTGYGDAPSGVTIAEGMSYNAYFPGHQVAMPPPLSDDGVDYADGTKATATQQARDVTAFLAWTTEPNMEARKEMGVMAILFLLVMTGLLYLSKRKIWADVH
ncbi:MAG: cytochrome c1 [Proteobacteria bacterium]|nr:cytochrome c1 [Pseudomonadota bacterium]